MSWNAKQYAVFRAILGAYLFSHFVALIPWGTELFSSAGTLSAAASPLIGVFPNVLGWWDAPWFVTAFLAAGAVLSLMLAAGRRDRLAAVGLWFIWGVFAGAEPAHRQPGHPVRGMVAALPRSGADRKDAELATSFVVHRPRVVRDVGRLQFQRA